jgi:hypothetical protein
MTENLLYVEFSLSCNRHWGLSPYTHTHRKKEITIEGAIQKTQKKICFFIKKSQSFSHLLTTTMQREKKKERNYNISTFIFSILVGYIFFCTN